MFPIRNNKLYVLTLKNNTKNKSFELVNCLVLADNGEFESF